MTSDRSMDLLGGALRERDAERLGTVLAMQRDDDPTDE
jgi:hypothetical protein